MTDEEKAREIAKNDALYGKDPDNNSKTDECYIAALEMAAWKEEQMIEKAVEWLKKNLTYIHPRKGTEECIVNISKFKEAMKND